MIQFNNIPSGIPSAPSSRRWRVRPDLLAVSSLLLALPATGFCARYVMTNPGMVSSKVMSLANNNVISAGNTTLHLDRNQVGAVYGLRPGIEVTGTGPFELSSAKSATDCPPTNP